MALIHFEDYTEDCPAYSEDFSTTADTMDPVTCPSCCGFARADAVQAQERHRRDPDGMPCKCGADNCPELRNQNIINDYL